MAKAVCDVCGREMVDGGTCDKSPIALKTPDGKIKEFDQIPFGSETHKSVWMTFKYQNPNKTEQEVLALVDEFMKLLKMGKYLEADATCTDCGVKVGGYHHPGCDQEECPQCSMQLQCDCIPTEEN